MAAAQNEQKPVFDRTPYDFLGVSTNASRSEIKKAYKKLCIKTHPDKNGDSQAFQKVKLAYDVLGDSQLRAHFDRYGYDAHIQNYLKASTGFVFETKPTKADDKGSASQARDNPPQEEPDKASQPPNDGGDDSKQGGGHRTESSGSTSQSGGTRDDRDKTNTHTSPNASGGRRQNNADRTDEEPPRQSHKAKVSDVDDDDEEPPRQSLKAKVSDVDDDDEEPPHQSLKAKVSDVDDDGEEIETANGDVSMRDASPLRSDDHPPTSKSSVEEDLSPSDMDVDGSSSSAERRSRPSSRTSASLASSRSSLESSDASSEASSSSFSDSSGESSDDEGVAQGGQTAGVGGAFIPGPKPGYLCMNLKKDRVMYHGRERKIGAVRQIGRTKAFHVFVQMNDGDDFAIWHIVSSDHFYRGLCKRFTKAGGREVRKHRGTMEDLKNVNLDEFEIGGIGTVVGRRKGVVVKGGKRRNVQFILGAGPDGEEKFYDRSTLARQFGEGIIDELLKVMSSNFASSETNFADEEE